MLTFALVLGSEPRVYQVAPGVGDERTEEPFTVAEPYRWVPCPEGTTEFHTFDGQESFSAPMAAPTPPPDISDRQFAAGLWEDGIITYADFLDFIGPGKIPAPMQAIVDTLADDDTGQPTPRKMAVGFLTGSKTYEFAHPLVEEFRQAMAAQDKKWTPDFLRQQWLTWATL